MLDVTKDPMLIINTLRQLQTEAKLNKAGKKDDGTSDIDQLIYLKYCSTKEVNEKRQIFLIFKAQFLAKLFKLKLNGQKQSL